MRRLTRRHLLRTAGATAALAALPDCRNRDSGSPPRDAPCPDPPDSAPDIGCCESLGWDPPRAPEVTVPEGTPSRGAFNVLVLHSDQHNAAFMSHLAHPFAFTPNLDRLASEGLRLTRAYASSPVCMPARASILTGLHALEHGVPQNGYKLHEGYPSVVSLFGQAGLRTACFGKLHTGNDECTLTFGFDEALTFHCVERWAQIMAEALGDRTPSEPDPDELPLWESLPVDYMTGLPQVWPEENRDQVMLWQARDWLRQHGDERFFLYVSLITPHHPFYMPEAFYYLYNPDEVWPSDTRSPTIDDSWQGWKVWSESGCAEMSEAQTRLCLARYLGAVTWTDHLLGQLLDELDAMGLSENTLVVYASDHGELAGEKGLWFKTLPFEAANRLPLILRMPGHIAAGSVDDLRFNQADLLPTLAGLVEASDGLEALGVSGQDHSALLLGQEGPRPEHAFSTIGLANDDGVPLATIAVGERFKLVRYIDWVGEAYEAEFYDLLEDPGETRNLARTGDCAEAREALEAAVEGFLDGLAAPRFPLEHAI